MSFLEWAMSDDTGRMRPVADPVVEQPSPALEWDAGLDNGFIEPRQWLLGNTFARRYVSTIVADGGTGKTALRLAQAVALATGRPITGEHVFRRCRVLYVSLEDDADEMRRRIKACCRHHKIDRAELRDHLFAVGLANGPKLAASIRGGAIAPGELGNLLTEIIQRRNIDLVVLDPFIKSHGCDENDNNAIDFVSGMLAELAIRFNVAIDAPHHVSKGMTDPGNANRGRGASAFKDAARLVYTLSKMTQAKATVLGIEEGDRWRYVRVDSAKVNIAPAAATATWFRLVGVPLGNASVIYPSGDEVQTVEPWTPVDLMALVNDEDLRRVILTEIKNAPPHALYSAHPNSGQRHVFQIFGAVRGVVGIESGVVSGC
jgi:AAA domain